MIKENILNGCKFNTELNFTETYKQYKDEHIAIREAMCLKALNPAVFTDLKENDLVAGRIKYGIVGFGLEQDAGGKGGYAARPYLDEITQRIEEAGLDDDCKKKVWDMVDYWQKESTENKYKESLPQELKSDEDNQIAGGGIRLAGVLLNFDKLLKIGLPGLAAEINIYRERALQEGKDVKIYDGMSMALETLTDVIRYYIERSKEHLENTRNKEWKAELNEMINALERIIVAKPETFREAVQLFWLYALISGVVNYGRMDIYLGDFYAKDIDSGLITEEKALRLIKSVWQLIADRKIVFNGRIIIGGMGRRNEKNADRFAMLAMEATRMVVETEPQLTLRFYKGMNPSLMKKALDVIGEGRIYPMLYNDDINVPSVQNAFNVSREEAEQYLPYGCGEYALDHISFGSPNCVINLMKALEATLHNGKDGLTGKPLGLKLGEINSFDTFDNLFEAYKKQVEHYTQAMAWRHVYEYRAERRDATYLFASMLYDHCIERGKSIVDGGARYLGGVAESFGMVNVSDSLAAIKYLVYDKKLMTLEHLMRVLDANFAGYEKEYKMMLDAPKYGNDDDYVDEIAREVSNHACLAARGQAEKVGFDYFLIVNINNFVNVTIGKTTAASADGRKDGEPYANGNTPTAGRDKNGVTAFLNSIAKLDPSIHAGYVHNMKFSKQMFKENRPQLETLLNVYFAKGGTQAMITVVSRDDLQNAMEEPEKYGNIIVRVGGYSARFVELSRDIQVDILNRTLY